MTYELRLERLFDASPETVFDVFVDRAMQRELHDGDGPDWVVGLPRAERGRMAGRPRHAESGRLEGAQSSP